MTINNYNKELESRGISISKLRYGGKSYGLNGKLLFRFVLPNSITSSYQLDKDELANELPPTKLKIGDRIGIRNSKSNHHQQYEIYGIVYKIEKSEIIIQCDYNVAIPLEHEYINFSMDKLDQDSNSINISNNSNQQSPLEILESNLHIDNSNNSYTTVTTSTSNKTNSKPAEPNSIQLDQDQLDIIKSILLNQDKISIINGQHGTGKTTTIIPLILQLIKDGKKVLVCGESQISVDSILDKLLNIIKKQHHHQSSTINITRIGQPSSIYSSQLSKYSLDNKILCDSNYLPVIKEMRKEIKSIIYLSWPKNQDQKNEINNQVNQLLNNLSEREKSFIDSTLGSSNIVLSSISDLSLPVFKGQQFDWIIIDSKHSVTCIPIQQLSNYNHHQQQHQSQDNYNIKTLTNQYRMNNKIYQLSNYLLNHLDNNNKSTNNNKNSSSSSSSNSSSSGSSKELSSITMIDTSGCDMEEYQEYSNDIECISNEGEVRVIEKEIERLLESGINQQDIGIITFFIGQIKLLKLKLSSKYPDIEIGTPGQFEGREKDTIIISTVRSNSSPHKYTSNLDSISNSIQLSINNSRNKIIIIGDSDTLSINNKLNSIIQYIKDNGLYKSVLEQ